MPLTPACEHEHLYIGIVTKMKFSSGKDYYTRKWIVFAEGVLSRMESNETPFTDASKDKPYQNEKSVFLSMCKNIELSTSLCLQFDS